MGTAYKHIDVHKLIEESKKDPNVITIEATVITGFEFQAADECKEKCKPLSICRTKGRIYFNIPLENYPKVFTLKSVDNLFLVGESMKQINFEGNKEKDLETIKALVHLVDWKPFISTWAKLVSFDGILFPDKTKEISKVENENATSSASSLTELGGGDCLNKSDEHSNLVVNHAEVKNDISLNDVDLTKQETDASLPSLMKDSSKKAISSDQSEINIESEESLSKDITSEKSNISSLKLGQGDNNKFDEIDDGNPSDDVESLLSRSKKTIDDVSSLVDSIKQNLEETTQDVIVGSVLVDSDSKLTQTTTLDEITHTMTSSISQNLSTPSQITTTIDNVIEGIAGLASSEEQDSKLSEVTVKYDGNVDTENSNETVVSDLKTPISENFFSEKTKCSNNENSSKEDDFSNSKTDSRSRGNERSNRGRNRQGGKKRFGKHGWSGRGQKGSGVGPKPYVDDGILKYRVTCYRAGNHSFASMDAACDFGGRLQDTFGWTVDLTRFDLNVLLIIEQDSGYVTGALTKESFHRRNISHFGRTTLRATMCYNLVRLAEPVNGEIIMDPLCGGGSIPIEGAISFPYTYHIGGDIDEKSLIRTRGNMEFVTKSKGYNFDAVRWDALNLPLRDQSIDVFVTDLPFGKRSGDKKQNFELYKNLLLKLARVVKTGTGRASLMSYDRKSLIQAIWATDFWKQIRNVSVNQGGLNSSVFLLLRTAKPAE